MILRFLLIKEPSTTMQMTTHYLLLHANTDVLKKVLEEESCNLINWFLLILLKQIPQNFRQFVLGKGHMMILLLLKLSQLKLSVKIMSLF